MPGGRAVLDHLRREVADFLELMHEAFHLLPRVLGLQLHGLADVLALGELHGES